MLISNITPSRYLILTWNAFYLYDISHINEIFFILVVGFKQSAIKFVSLFH